MEDFEILFKEVGESKASLKLRSTNGWNFDGNGTDDYGFSAFPMGLKSENIFSSTGTFAYFWSADERDDDEAKAVVLEAARNMALKKNYDKDDKLSVRCVKN